MQHFNSRVWGLMGRSSAALLGSVLLCVPSMAQQDLLFTVTNEGGPHLEVRAPTDGTLLSSTALPMALVLGDLTHDGARLWTPAMLETTPVTVLTSLHPASGQAAHAGTTWSGTAEWSLAFDEAEDTLYAADGKDVYRVDRSTGVPVFFSALSPLSNSIQCMTVDSVGCLQGVCETEVIPSGYGMCSPGGQACGIGFFGHNLGKGKYLDIAYDSKDRLWMSWRSAGAVDNSGLYRVSKFSFLPKLMQAIPAASVPVGIAFGPATAAIAYCTAKQGATGCVPQIAGAGIASPTAASGYTVTATGARNNKVGLLMLSTSGRNQAPFNGGTLCIQPPQIRTQLVNSGGNPAPADDCSGTWSFDVNAVLSTKPGFSEGTVVQAQWFGRDSAPSNLALSDALEFALLP